VQLTVQVQLKPTPDQFASLIATMRQANGACDWISDQAWRSNTFRKFDLHKLA
jgi:hypothetical protein